MAPVRRVRRVVRRIDPWTVLKVSFVFNAIMALAFVLGSVIFWSIFVNAGVPDKITDFAERLTLTFEADGELYFRVVLLLAVIWAILMTGLATLGSVLYNLIADTVGGVEVVVLEEVITTPVTPGGNVGIRPARRPATRRASPPRQASATPRPPVPATDQPAAAATVEAAKSESPPAPAAPAQQTRPADATG